jgi:cytochrome P450
MKMPSFGPAKMASLVPITKKPWFLAYMKNRGFRDDLSKRLAERKKEDPKTDRDDILSFMDYIEVDEGRSL